MSEIKKSSILQLVTMNPVIHEDYRGTFVEFFNQAEFDGVQQQLGANIRFVRSCVSTSSRNVLRGIHYDDKTWKLIQCMKGKIYFVVVDMRPNSPTRLIWESFILSEENRLQVLVPPMYGNGHLVLSDSCTFHYRMSEYYDPANEKLLKWNDPAAAIHWPTAVPILSAKDEA